jgi:hypothetical protein
LSFELFLVLMKLNAEVQSKSVPTIANIRKDLMLKWFKEAYEECREDVSRQDFAIVGGPLFSEYDSSTYWNDTTQFLNWWKNNVERKTKMALLTQDASYNGIRLKGIQRRHWCKAILELVASIRKHMGEPREMFQQSSHSQDDPYSTSNKNRRSGDSNTYSVASTPSGSRNANQQQTAQGPPDVDSEKVGSIAFLFRIHDALVNERQDILSFDSTGIRFSVYNVEAFRQYIMPKYFKSKLDACCLFNCHSFSSVSRLFLRGFSFLLFCQ